MKKARKAPDERDPYAVACGNRLKALRQALGYTSTIVLARTFELPKDRVYKWESGAALVPPRFLHDLSERHDRASYYDFIYDGDVRYMPTYLVDRLLSGAVKNA